MNFIFNLILISLTFTFSLCLPNGCNCRLGVLPRIVRGKDSEHVPWQVSVKANGQHKCSGLILNDELILTLSSCITGYEIKELEILAGVTRLNDEKTENNYKIQSISLTGSPGNGANNTAILKLSRKLEFKNLKIEKACLRMFDKKYGGFLNLKTLLTTGWGFDEAFIVDEDGRSNKEIKPTNNLKKAYIKYNGSNKDFFFVRPSRFRQSLCTFDEGSPLMNQENGRSIVIGFADDILQIEHDREPGKFIVCNGEGRFIKFSKIDEFLRTNFDTSEMCLQYRN